MIAAAGAPFFAPVYPADLAQPRPAPAASGQGACIDGAGALSHNGRELVIVGLIAQLVALPLGMAHSATSDAQQLVLHIGGLGQW